jgi:hypothetical protein
MIGNLEVLRLREAAGTKLGEHFDIRAFHDQVLGRGSVTLPLLRTLLEEWIESSSSRVRRCSSSSSRRLVRSHRQCCRAGSPLPGVRAVARLRASIALLDLRIR